MEPHYDVVCILLETPFCEWKEEDKIWTVKNGRQTPPFSRELEFSDKSNYQPSWYELFPWLCGSYYLKKLFCWPCLINGIKTYEMEFIDFDNATKNILISHERSFRHLKNALKLKELAKVLQVPDFYNKCSFNIVEHNKNVILNRRLMQLLIKAILFVTKQQLPSGRSCQNKTIIRNDNFKELLNLFVSESPLELKQQYPNVKSYLESESVQNDLIHCLCTHINNFVKKDVSESPFYSVEIDRLNRSCCIITVRYVTSDGLVVERPLDFLHVNKSCSAEEFFEQLQTILYSLNYQSKLVAQCYDGESIIRENLFKLQKEVKLQAPQALFLHCFNHKFEEIIVKSLCNIPECQAFFCKIHNIPCFFNLTKRLETFVLPLRRTKEKTVKDLFDKAKLSTSYKIVSVSNMLFFILKDIFKNIVSDTSFGSATIRQANTYVKCFNDVEFIFLLLAFNSIFGMMTDLFNVLQIKSMDMSFVLNEVDNIQVKLANIRTSTNFNSIYKQSKERADKILIGHEDYYEREDICKKFKLLYFKILDSIAHELNIRFKDSENLSFISLAEWSNFKSFSKFLPDSAYIQPLYSYANVMSDIDRLRNELKLFYSVIPYKEYGIEEILIKMKKDGTCEIFKEIYKLFSLIITLPCIDLSANKFIFSPKRIQSYLKSIYENENFQKEFQASLTMLSIGQEVIDYLSKTSMLYDDIIDNFVILKGEKIPLIVQR